ncbi:hypothetical protein FQN49_007661 [Arthroderma sp. PD_2]|nr:hypothetical protein FQN49_007661 [Arthroderma sp. PD_2]
MAYLNEYVETPVTAHSTCSIFSLPSPDIQPRVNLGYEPEYPYNLDFNMLKPANGYALGMRSAPLHPSTLEAKNATMSKLREVATPKHEEDRSHEAYHDVNDGNEANIKIPEKGELDEPASDSETNTSNGTPALSNSPTTPISTGFVNHENITPPNQKLAYSSRPSPPPPPTPAPKLLEAPKKPSVCGGYSVYKNSLPFRQLGYASQGKTVTREITISRPIIEVPSLSPSPPPQQWRRTALREPLLPMLIYHQNGEEEYVSRYNYLPFGQGREPAVSALDMLLAHARSRGFTTSQERRPFASRDWYNAVTPERKPMAPARREARENLLATLSRRVEFHPQQTVMPNPLFHWMRR